MFSFYEQLLFATSGVKVADASSSFISYMMPVVTKQSDITSYRSYARPAQSCPIGLLDPFRSVPVGLLSVW